MHLEVQVYIGYATIQSLTGTELLEAVLATRTLIEEEVVYAGGKTPEAVEKAASRKAGVLRQLEAPSESRKRQGVLTVQQSLRWDALHAMPLARERKQRVFDLLRSREAAEQEAGFDLFDEALAESQVDEDDRRIVVNKITAMLDKPEFAEALTSFTNYRRPSAQGFASMPLDKLVRMHQWLEGQHDSELTERENLFARFNAQLADPATFAALGEVVDDPSVFGPGFLQPKQTRQLEFMLGQMESFGGDWAERLSLVDLVSDAFADPALMAEFGEATDEYDPQRYAKPEELVFLSLGKLKWLASVSNGFYEGRPVASYVNQDRPKPTAGNGNGNSGTRQKQRGRSADKRATDRQATAALKAAGGKAGNKSKTGTK